MTALHNALHNMPLFIYIFLLVLTFLGSMAGSVKTENETTIKNAIDTLGSWLIGFPLFFILILAYWWV
jgi:hypothetical protein